MNELKNTQTVSLKNNQCYRSHKKGTLRKAKELILQVSWKICADDISTEEIRSVYNQQAHG